MSGPESAATGRRRRPQPTTPAVENDDNATLTPVSTIGEVVGELPRKVENRDYMEFAQRIIRAVGRRVGEGDIEVLPALVALEADVRDAVNAAIDGLRDCEFSYAEIGERLGQSRQAVQQRHERLTAKRAKRAG